MLTRNTKHCGTLCIAAWNKIKPTVRVLPKWDPNKKRITLTRPTYWKNKQ